MRKYRNVKTTINGIKFDSKAEAEYYLIAKTYARQNNLELRLQEKFEIMPGFSLGGKNYRKINYIPDFTFYEDGQLVKVVDVKGMQTKDFKIKAKIFCYKYRTPLILAKKTTRGFEEIKF